MPTFVNPDACNSCAGVHQGPLCVYICPGDLMILDPEMKGLNREPDMCSECFACVKVCPEGAIEARGYADFVPLGATVKPKRDDHEIFWEIKFRDGRRLTYTYPIRSTQVGSTEPYKGFAAPQESAFRGTALAGDEIWLGVDTLPAPKGRA